jgi:hypothetical protein
MREPIGQVMHRICSMRESPSQNQANGSTEFVCTWQDAQQQSRSLAAIVATENVQLPRLEYPGIRIGAANNYTWVGR